MLVVRGLVCAVVFGGFLNLSAVGQESSSSVATQEQTQTQAQTQSAALELPDSPGYSSSVRQQQQGNGGSGVASEILGGVAGGAEANADPRRTHRAKKYDKYIDRNEIPQMLSERDKVILGLRASVTPFAGISIVAAAGRTRARLRRGLERRRRGIPRNWCSRIACWLRCCMKIPGTFS